MSHIVRRDEHARGPASSHPGPKLSANNTRPWSLRRPRQDPDALRSEHGVERTGELARPVPHQELHRSCSLAQVHQEVAGGLRRPCAVRVRGNADQVSMVGAVLDHDQGVEAAEQHGVHVDEVDGDDAAGLSGQELLPGRAGAAGRGIDSGIVQDLPDREGGDRVAEPDQLASHSPVPPCGVLRRDADHELADRGTAARDAGGSRSPTCASRAAGARRAGSRVSPGRPHPTGTGGSAAIAPRATTGRLAGNGPGRPGGAALRSRAAAPRARRPWTPGAGSVPSGNPASSERAGRRPK
jgi:hypothetical protein